MKKIRIVLGADHAGFTLKEDVKKYLNSLPDYQVEDVGTSNDASVDYPDIAKKAVERYFADPVNSLAILICGTGIGMSIAANKFPKIYCALSYDSFTAKMARQHNQANFLALGARVNYHEEITSIVSSFLNATAETGRHLRRFNKIKQLEGDK